MQLCCNLQLATCNLQLVTFNLNILTPEKITVNNCYH